MSHFGRSYTADMMRERLIARRKALGFSQIGLAHAIGCDRNTVSRWERGLNDVAPHHREPLGNALELTAIDLEALLNGDGIESNGANTPNLLMGWWTNYETIEQSAVSVRTWEPMVIPGLLQIESYAAALLDGTPNASDLVARRLERQAMLTRSVDPVELVAIVDESVLHRPIGGFAVLADQLAHLVAMASRRNVTIQVLPADAPDRALLLGGNGTFVILGVPWPGGLVHLEHVNGARSLDAQHELEDHIRAFDELRNFALSPTESVDLIRREMQP